MLVRAGHGPARTRWPLSLERGKLTLSDMKKRALATILWFYAGWTLGALISWSLAPGLALGPIAAIVAAGVVLRGPQLNVRRRATA